MSIGSPFHPRTAELNRKLQWREWAGQFAASAYADAHDIEYNAVREAVGLIDVSPLYKYQVNGPDAAVLADRIQVRNAGRMKVGQVHYTCWCDEAGRVIDDGTLARLDAQTFRWTAADPQLRWFRMNATGLDVEIEEISETVGALAVQGPLSRALLEAASGESFADLRYFRRRPAKVAGVPVDVSRTGYTGDLGYELWVSADRAPALWDGLMRAGTAFGARPVGMLALDVVRIEAGLILLDVDYTSSRHALTAEQAYSPFEIGLGRLVDFEKGEFVGRRALLEERHRGGPARRLVGLRVDWPDVERQFAAQGLPPAVPAIAWRAAVPVFGGGGRQVGRATSGTWSPILKELIALASVEADQAEVGRKLELEWTVEARRGRVRARVSELPFFDPPRKRA